MKKKLYGHARSEGARFEMWVYEGRFGIVNYHLEQIRRLKGDLQRWLRVDGERISISYENAFGCVSVRVLYVLLRRRQPDPVQTDEVGHGTYSRAGMTRVV